MTGYLTIDCDSRHLLFVNYWDSVIGSIALTPSGKLGPVVETLAPPTPVVARHLEDHLNNRRLHHILTRKLGSSHRACENRTIGTTCACNRFGSLLFEGRICTWYVASATSAPSIEQFTKLFFACRLGREQYQAVVL